MNKRKMKEINQVIISVDETGKRIVVIPKLIFKGKRSIDWREVEKYLLKYVGEIVQITDSEDIIYIGKDFPDEYTGSEYSAKLRGGPIAKVKANLSQGIPELIEIAENKRWQENYKQKNEKKAKYGWYRYTTRFAMPVINNDGVIEHFNIFNATLIIRRAANDKMYLYDVQNIKKETSTPLWTNCQMV